MTRILRIDMGRLRAEAEEVPDDLRLLGGRALSSHLVGREVPPACDPLGAENKLAIAPGLLGGTAVTTSGRTSMGGKSPLTGGVKEANVGGLLGHKLAKLGYKAVIIEGQPPDSRWRLLRLDSRGVTFEEADALAGLGSYDVARRLLGHGVARPACIVSV